MYFDGDSFYPLSPTILAYIAVSLFEGAKSEMVDCFIVADYSAFLEYLSCKDGRLSYISKSTNYSSICVILIYFTWIIGAFLLCSLV